MLVIWSALVAGSLAWYMHLQQQSVLNTATAAARANIHKDQGFRKWAATHGGVYVPPTEHTPPNPYLNVPDRDVVTTTGKTLTLMNPAYMLRQLQSDFPGDYGTLSHITSLKPINPNNAPDAWEDKALHVFERGGKELLETQQIDGQPYLRMMLPLMVEQGCLKCHAQQGYKLGEIRGGISTAVPLAPFLAREQEVRDSLIISHGAVWLLGLAGLAWLGVSFRRVQRLEILSSSAAAVEKSERRFRAVAESANDAIINADSASKVVDWNPSAERLFGYTKAEIIGQPLTVLMPERFRDLHSAGLARVAAGGTPHAIGKTVELAGLRKNGSEFPLELSLAQWQTAEGRFFTAIIRDITERKKAEAELQEMFGSANQSRLSMLSIIEDQKRAEAKVRRLNAELEEKVIARTAALEQARLGAEQANRAKSAFLSAMSHEIRTPMNGVVGMIDVLQQSNLTGPQIEMANIIHDSAFALLAIIDDILDFSKIEAGKLQIDYAPMSVAGVVEGVCETLIPLALKKGVELTLFTDPSIPSQVMGDVGRLRQILVNLANNAIKFSSGQDRQGKVSVRAVLVENGSGSGRTVGGDLEQVTLEFRITDNGIGIDKETQKRLFSPFTQADSTTTRNFGGTGLGLAISRQLANIMGGEIMVRSETGKGSLFGVRLPFKLLPEQMDVVRLKPEEHMGGHPHDLRELPCLVADGSGGLADDLAAYLGHAGALVERADLAAIGQWIVGRQPGLCIVVIDTEGVKPQLDELRAAARARNLDVRFVAVERGGRRHCRVVATDLVALDAEVMHRLAFLEAVAIAAGRAEQPGPGAPSSYTKAAPVPLSREEARRRGSLILVAEDNEINQKVILQQLMLLGQVADVANNGREALKRWQSGGYAILFSDLHMPEMDGYGLTAAIRADEKANANKPRTPIIAFTANALKGEAEHCLAIGMDDYLSKPVQLADLKAMLEKWLPRSPHDNAGNAPGFHPGYGAAPPEGVGRAASPFATSGDSGQALPADEKTGRAEPDLQQQGGGNMPVDVNVLKALIGDDEAMIREFLHDFRLSAEKIAAELRTACAANQAEAAGALAHKLKSSSRSVGALALGELCAAMEKAGKGGDAETLVALLSQFEHELSSVVRFLEGF